jgi:hypothetical protein
VGTPEVKPGYANLCANPAEASPGRSPGRQSRVTGGYPEDGEPPQT